MNTETQGGLLILTGGVVARMAMTGTYLLYVRQGMRPWLLCSALVLLVLGVLRMWSALRAEPTTAATAADAHDPHDAHERREPHAPRVAWLLVLPVLAVVLIAPNPLGSFTAARQSSAAAVVAPPDPFPPLQPSADGTVALPVMEFVRRALFDDRQSLAGVPVRMVGMVAPAAKGGTEDFRLVRFTIACCAADAQAIQVAAHGLRGGDLPTDAWVEVVGRWRAPTAAEADDQVPPFELQEIKLVPRPENPYEG